VRVGAGALSGVTHTTRAAGALKVYPLRRIPPPRPRVGGEGRKYISADASLHTTQYSTRLCWSCQGARPAAPPTTTSERGSTEDTPTPQLAAPHSMGERASVGASLWKPCRWRQASPARRLTPFLSVQRGKTRRRATRRAANMGRRRTPFLSKGGRGAVNPRSPATQATL